jgi:hypothetical protein
MHSLNSITALLQLSALAAATFPVALVALSMKAPQSTVPQINSRNKIPTPSQNDDVLRQMQQNHRHIAAAFVPSEFKPHPALTNCHLQTISGVFLRKVRRFSS